MSTHLKDLRTDLATTLAPTGARVFDYVPEMVSAPALIIQPADPYLTTDGEPFGHFRVAYLVSVVVDVATNERMTDDLDSLVGDTAAALEGAYAVESCSAPYQFSYNTASYLAVNLTVSDTLNFKE